MKTKLFGSLLTIFYLLAAAPLSAQDLGPQFKKNGGLGRQRPLPQQYRSGVSGGDREVTRNTCGVIRERLD